MEMITRELRDLRQNVDGIAADLAELRAETRAELGEVRAELAEVRAQMATKDDLKHLYATVRADMHRMQQELMTDLAQHIGRQIASHMGTIEEHVSSRFDVFEERWEGRWQDSERWRQRVVEAIGGI